MSSKLFRRYLVYIRKRQRSELWDTCLALYGIIQVTAGHVDSGSPDADMSQCQIWSNRSN